MALRRRRTWIVCALETYAVARWADLQKCSKFSYTRNIIALGDFNMPKKAPTDPIFKSLTSKGLEIPPHTSKVGSATASDAEYDQIAFFPGDTKDVFTGSIGVFDFDKVVFPDLWQQGQTKFRAPLRPPADVGGVQAVSLPHSVVRVPSRREWFAVRKPLTLTAAPL